MPTATEILRRDGWRCQSCGTGSTAKLLSSVPLVSDSISTEKIPGPSSQTESRALSPSHGRRLHSLRFGRGQ
jgi:hypothetical protein